MTAQFVARARGLGFTDDEIAVERYRYLLRTAPPETLEQVHAEAFAKLTDEQIRAVVAFQRSVAAKPSN